MSLSTIVPKRETCVKENPMKQRKPKVATAVRLGELFSQPVRLKGRAGLIGEDGLVWMFPVTGTLASVAQGLGYKILVDPTEVVVPHPKGRVRIVGVFYRFGGMQAVTGLGNKHPLLTENSGTVCIGQGELKLGIIFELPKELQKMLWGIK